MVVGPIEALAPGWPEAMMMVRQRQAFAVWVGELAEAMARLETRLAEAKALAAEVSP